MKPPTLRLPLLPAAIFCVLRFGSCLTAQQLDHPVTYNLSLQASWVTGIGGFSGSLVDETGTQINFGAGSGSSPDSVKTVQLLPNKDYTVSVTVPDTGYPSNQGMLTFSRPGSGLVVYLDAALGYTKTFGVGSSTFYVRIGPPTDYPNPDAPSDLRGGAASSFVTDKPIWYLGLGRLLNGQTAGAVGFRRQDFSGNIYTPAALYYDPADATATSPSTEVDVIYNSGALRQILSPEVLVDITTLSSTSYQLNVYPNSPNNVSGPTGGLYIGTGEFATYLIESIDNGMQITRTEDGVDWKTSLTLTGANTWTRQDWHCTSAAVPSSVTTVYSPDTSGTVTQSGPSSGLPGDTSLVWTKQFTDYGWGKELTSTSYGAGLPVPLTSTYSYYATTGSGAFASLLETQVDPTGNWAKYTYYDFNDPGGDAGLIEQIYRPWLDNPGSPDSATAANSVVETYTYDTSFFDWVKTDIVTAPNGTLSDTEWTYSNASPLNGETVIAAVRTDRTSDETLVTNSKVFSPATTTAYYRSLPVSTGYPDGHEDSYAYFNGTWDPGANAFAADDAGPDRLVLAFHGQTSGGTSTSSWAVSGVTHNIDPICLVANRSTFTGTVTDATGRSVFAGEYVYTGPGNLPLISGTSYTYDDHGRVLTENDVARNVQTSHAYSASAAGAYAFSIETTAPDGVITRDDYDPLMRLAQTTVGKNGPQAFPAKMHQTVYDPANRPVAAYGCSCQTSPTRYFYDTAGRLVTKNEFSPNDSPGASAGSLVTSYDYSVIRNATTTLPTGATRIEQTYLDGRPKSVSGTAQAPLFYSYVVNGTGLLTTTYNAASADPTNGWSADQTDWLGRIRTHTVPAYGWSVSNPTTIAVTSTYAPSTGLLEKQTTSNGSPGPKLLPDHLYFYDPDGRLNADGLDVNGDGSLSATDGNGGNDRFVTHGDAFVNNFGWTRVVTTSTYATLNSAAVTTLSSVTSRLTGFASGTVDQTVSVDANGFTTTRTVSLDTANKIDKTTIQLAGANGQSLATNTAFQSTKNGYDYQAHSFTGEQVERAYDFLGRLQYVYSRWNGSSYDATDSYGYFGDTTYVETMTIGSVPTSFSYAWNLGTRTVTTTDALGNASYTLYNAMDLPFHLGGAGAMATAFGYDALGRRLTQTTYRDGPFTETNWPSPASDGDKTQWTLDAPTGLVTQKKFADGTHDDFTYTALGQPRTRISARNIETDYAYYDGSGQSSSDVSYFTQELKSVTYQNDPANTPSVTFTYERSGLPAGVDDATGSRTFAHDSTYPARLTTETLPAFYNSGSNTRTHTFEYDAYGRATGFDLGTSSSPATDLSQTLDYFPDSGLPNHLYTASNSSSTQTFTYGYKPDSALVDYYHVGTGTSTSTGFAVTYNYDATSAARPSQVLGEWNGVPVTQFDLLYDSRGLVQSAQQSGSAYADYYGGTGYSSVYNEYVYDELGQVKTAAMYRGVPPGSDAPPSGDELPGRRFEYRYDNAGNRATAGATGTAAGGDDVYTPNSLNQYQTKENNTLRVLGTAAPTAHVAAVSTSAASDLPVTKTDRSFAAGVVPLNNTNGPAQGTVTAYAAIQGSGGGADVIGTQTKNWQIPQRLQTFTYDADGNLTNDGVWSNTYDAENRLVKMTSLLPTGQNFSRLRLDFTYDYLGRRVQKIVTDLDSNEVTLSRRYLYDGWNLVAEFDAPGGTSCGAMQRSFTWGLDVAGSLGATGGVGALVQIADVIAGKTYYPTYDGSGNVAALVDGADGTLAATYEYSPFGQLLRGEGPYAASNPFRFSTKFTDAETGLVYYGLRYYSPALGRFVNRDPIEEQSGFNLYGFVGNNPVNGVDILGLAQPVDNVNVRCHTTTYYSTSGPCTVTTTVRVCDNGDVFVNVDKECTNSGGGPGSDSTVFTGGYNGGPTTGSGSTSGGAAAPNTSPCAALQAQRAKINAKLSAVSNAITRANSSYISAANGPAVGSTLDTVNTGYNYDANATTVSNAASIVETVSNVLGENNAATGLAFTGFGIIGISNDLGHGFGAVENGQTGEAVSRLAGGALGTGVLLGSRMAEQGLFGKGIAQLAKVGGPLVALAQTAIFAGEEAQAYVAYSRDLNAMQGTLDQFNATQSDLIGELGAVHQALTANNCK